ncbi:hypothetical protein [Mesorhizobium sp. B2-4-19]|uniref:hypothetical protein n=1 Tax=Mesorhizobium sp. B2-4-19 TaxID=2589930 RepID=UPI0015E36A53|nr:hypothetical protein [Mesorhizobium sp. B2-4-19]
MPDRLILAAAAFFAGMLNTAAGRRHVPDLPALVYTGYLGVAAGFRGEIRTFDSGRRLKATAATAGGGLVGSPLLPVSSKEESRTWFRSSGHWPTPVFAFNDHFRCVMETHAAGGGAVGTTVDAAHGGYFNGGLGIMLLALFSLWECATSTR